MATKKITKKTTKKVPAKATSRGKLVKDCTVKECIQENTVLKLHVTIITILSIVVCVLVLALVLAIKS